MSIKPINESSDDEIFDLLHGSIENIEREWPVAVEATGRIAINTGNPSTMEKYQKLKSCLNPLDFSMVKSLVEPARQHWLESQVKMIATLSGATRAPEIVRAELGGVWGPVKKGLDQFVFVAEQLVGYSIFTPSEAPEEAPPPMTLEQQKEAGIVQKFVIKNPVKDAWEKANRAIEAMQTLAEHLILRINKVKVQGILPGDPREAQVLAEKMEP
jgi:hypothetical protein